MPIIEVTYYAASCDICKKSWVNEHHGWSAMSDKLGIKEMLMNDEWHLEDGKTYCPNCHEIDDDDNLILKEVKP